jgi:hypothetical protein
LEGLGKLKENKMVTSDAEEISLPNLREYPCPTSENIPAKLPRISTMAVHSVNSCKRE